ncbi:MAG: TIGR00366 family protein, partial [Acinetobacter sp.]
NAFINLFIPSCSGQAAVVIPLMMPVGEVLGISPQVVVSAFIYGDGLTNLCIPTFGVLVGSLMMAKVPFGKWLRFAVPFVAICAVGLSVLLFVLTSIGWTGL